MKYFIFITTFFVATFLVIGNSNALPTNIDNSNCSDDNFEKQNALEAEKLNKQFENLKPDSDCENDENACIDGKFAKCNFGKFVLTDCGPKLSCFALPLVNKQGTSVTCDTKEDAENRIELARQCRSKTG